MAASIDGEKVGVRAFDSLLFSINLGLSPEEDLSHLLFLARQYIPKQTKETIKYPLEVFEILESRGVISENKLDYLDDILRKMGKEKLRALLPKKVEPGEKYVRLFLK